MDALIDDCTSWIDRLRGVSFVELERWWAQRTGESATGDIAIELPPPHENLWLWAGVSEAFADFTVALQASGRTMLDPIGSEMEAFLIYSADGKVPTLPIARRPPKKGYREPHWAPVMIRVRTTERIPNPEGA